jgi:hypothetical protein
MQRGGCCIRGGRTACADRRVRVRYEVWVDREEKPACSKSYRLPLSAWGSLAGRRSVAQTAKAVLVKASPETEQLIASCCRALDPRHRLSGGTRRPARARTWSGERRFAAVKLVCGHWQRSAPLARRR